MGSEAEAKSSQGHAKWVSMLMLMLCICGAGMVLLSTQLDHPAEDSGVHVSKPDAAAAPNILLQPKPEPKKPRALPEPTRVAKGDNMAELAKQEVELRAAVQAIKSSGAVMETDLGALEVAKAAHDAADL